MSARLTQRLTRCAISKQSRRNFSLRKRAFAPRLKWLARLLQLKCENWPKLRSSYAVRLKRCKRPRSCASPASKSSVRAWPRNLKFDSRLKPQEEAHQKAEIEAQLRDEREQTRLAEIEAVCAQTEATAAERARKEATLNEQIEALRQGEAAQQDRIAAAEVSFRAQQEAHQ